MATPMTPDPQIVGPADNAPETIYDLPGPLEAVHLEQPAVMAAMSGSLVPPTASQILTAARATAARLGVTVHEYPGWRDRCRCHDGSHERGEKPNGRIWGPFFGVMAHKTAGDLGSRTVEKYILDIILSDPAVPVKCQIVGAPNGDIWLVAAGRANHDLNMSAAAYAAYRDQTWSLTGYQNLRGTGYNGSGYTLGWEQIAAGIPTEAQRRSVVTFSGELSRLLGRTGQAFAGHGENASDRDYSDPQQDMGQGRRESIAVVNNPGATPPPITGGFLMALTDAQQTDLLQTVKNIEKALQYPGAGGASWFQALANQGNDERKVIDALAKALADDDELSDTDVAKIGAAIEGALLKVASEGVQADVTLTAKS